MKKDTYKGKWNLSSMLPKRDMACYDLEDLPRHQLRNLGSTKPDYPNFVTPDMIQETRYDADNLIVEDELVYDDGMVKIYVLIDEVEDMEMEVATGKYHNPITMHAGVHDLGGYLQRIFDANKEDLLEQMLYRASQKA